MSEVKDSAPTAELPTGEPVSEKLADVDITTSNEAAENNSLGDSIPPEKVKLGSRFWIVFASLCMTMLLSALDATIISTALPTITSHLHSTQYAWVVNSYTLSCTVFLLFIGQLADIFDRKPTMLASVFLFAAGSAICGAATNIAMLIGGRVIQGIGGGGIPVMAELICSDMVPIEQRPQYLGILLAVAALGTVIGPPIGGVIIQHTTWRWIFYLNLPLSGLALFALSFILRMRAAPADAVKLTLVGKVRKIDWVGNVLFAASSLALVLGLTMGGGEYPWRSANVIVPLVLGVIGLSVFGAYEKYANIEAPLLPSRLLNNYTAIAVYIQGMFTVLFLSWISFFITAYFQSVLRQSPTKAGVELLPTILAALPFAVVGGILMQKLKRAKEIHMVAAAIMTVGLGCFSLFNDHTSLAVRVILQIVTSMGAGLLMATLLPVVQAQLPESDLAAITALFSFMRSFGGVWGVTIPSIVFNDQINKHAYRVADTAVRAMLVNGGAYSRASAAFTESLSGITRIQVVDLYVSSFRITWIVAAAISGLGFLLAVFEKKVELRQQK